MGRKRIPWITERKKTGEEVPFESPVWLGNMSNGEFFLPQNARKRKMRELILQRCDEYARRKGMDRREFIASTMGMATTLSVFNLASGCGDGNGMMAPGVLDQHMDASQRGPYDGGSSSDAMAGADSSSGGPFDSGASGMGADAGPPPSMMGGEDGGFVVTPETCMDEELADQLFSSDYFILDFQTHHTNDGVPGLCLTGNTFCDTGPDSYVQQIFEDSETTVAVLSGLPASVDETTNDLEGRFAFRNEDMRASRDRINEAAQLNAMAGERMVAHCQISPRQNPEANARMMERFKRMHDTRGWKCYPPTEGGWFLHENDAFIQTAIDLGEPLVCVHKGFPFSGWSRTHADPMPDVGVVAQRYPDVNFVIYHSAFDSAHVEGPYNPNPDPLDGGTDRLSKVILDNNLANKNVYAEMGSAWALSMTDPTNAQHYVGKMLKHLGEDRVVWGSECVWFGSPQNQIEAMKAFRISQEFQDKYGYPEFTDSIRRKIFGLTGAKLYRVDPNLCRYQVSRGQLALRKRTADDRYGERRHAYNQPAIRTRRQFLELWRQRIAKGEIA